MFHHNLGGGRYIEIWKSENNSRPWRVRGGRGIRVDSIFRALSGRCPTKLGRGAEKGCALTKGGWFVFPLRNKPSLLLLFFRRDWPVHEKLTLVFPRACVSLHFHRSLFLFLLVSTEEDLGRTRCFYLLIDQARYWFFHNFSIYFRVFILSLWNFIYIVRVYRILWNIHYSYFLKIICNACLEIK